MVELVQSLESLSQLNAIAEQQDKELRQLKVSLFITEMPFKGGSLKCTLTARLH